MKKISYEAPIYTLFFGLIALGLYFGVVWLRNWGNPTPDFSVSAGSDSFVRVIDQKPYNDGVIIENRVYITDVDLRLPGFVAVYENPFDKYGALVGTSRFLTAGKHQYVPVDLVKEYKAGQRLYVLIHKDTGDAIYNLIQDPVVKNSYDAEIMDDFVIK